MKSDAQRTAGLCALAMVAFASNSLLCRAALADRSIDPASFALLRTSSGAVLLSLLVLAQSRPRALRIGGSIPAALALSVYMCGFAFAYTDLDAGTGALLLFGAVQFTMFAWAIVRGERPTLLQLVGMTGAVVGFMQLVGRGFTAPPLLAATSMTAAGVAWGCYTLLGRGFSDARAATAGNFLRATIITLPIAALAWGVHGVNLSTRGVLLAVASGALASGLGYAIWYAAVPRLTRLRAAVMQLTVPVLAAGLGVVLLGETVSRELLIAMVLVLGGVATALFAGRRDGQSHR